MFWTSKVITTALSVCQCNCTQDFSLTLLEKYPTYLLHLDNNYFQAFWSQKRCNYLASYGILKLRPPLDSSYQILWGTNKKGWVVMGSNFFSVGWEDYVSVLSVATLVLDIVSTPKYVRWNLREKTNLYVTWSVPRLQISPRYGLTKKDVLWWVVFFFSLAEKIYLYCDLKYNGLYMLSDGTVWLKWIAHFAVYILLLHHYRSNLAHL